MGLVKTRRLAYPPLAGADDPWGSRQAERCECRAMQKQQRAIHLRQGFHLRRGCGGRAGGLKAGMEVLPMWECCQFQCCQFSNGD